MSQPGVSIGRETTGVTRDTATGDLLRKRQSREVWISRSHLYGFVALVVVASATFFVVGFVLGRGSAPAAPPAAAKAADEELARLLASIELGRHPAGPRQVVNAASRYDQSPPVAEAAAPVPAAAPPRVFTGPGGPTEGLPAPADVPPLSRFTVVVRSTPSPDDARQLEVELTGLGLSAWTDYALVDGQPRFRVAVGGYASTAEAERVYPVVRAAGHEPLGVERIE